MGTASGLLALCASSSVTWAVAQGPPPLCTASIEHHDTPSWRSVEVVIGESGTGYDESELLVPEPVLLGVRAINQDTLGLRCLRDGQNRTVPSTWTAGWAISSASGSGGSFIDGSGRFLARILNADHVVYLPPRDLACGETRDITILLTLADLCTGIGDEDEAIDIELEVELSRQALGGTGTYYSVRITAEPPPPPEDNKPPCVGASTCCYLTGDFPQPGGGIDAVFQDGPRDGMRVGEMRPITVWAGDTDRLEIECGATPCLSVLDYIDVCGELKYTWKIDSGGGSLLSTGSTAVYRAGSTPGLVRIKLTVSNPKGDVYVDEPKDDILEFAVYGLDFIDQSNAVRPLLGQPDTSDLGLRVSNHVTDVGLNACGGPTPTFAGPTGPRDRNTYRIQLDTAGGPPGATFTVEVLSSRVWTDYEVHPSYSHEFLTLASDGSAGATLRRTVEHMRLVSNARPAGQTGLPVDYLYDDEACAEQSVYVQPGDWITAVLKVDGTRACAIELPVERPWSEANASPGVGPVSIATTSISRFRTTT